ncbi:MAG: tetratricopeptide repeat-containing sulfotransferase family protein [Brevundimonas sp.]|uniref:tetratricopeptide repeat-containing sulfotransferase family protein n=1 Tax=Brevundimonas sp. TaxID=1871086 RepID=UPI003919EBAC
MSPSSEDWLRRAVDHQNAGRLEEATAAFEALLALQPGLPDVWFDLGRLRRRIGRPEAALQAYDQALKQDVRGPEEARLNRAVILSEDLHRPDEAEIELQAALTLNPRFAAAWLNLGNLHEDRGRRDPARAAYEQALALEPGNVLALARLAGVARASGPDDSLIARLRAALKVIGSGTPDERMARADLGFALGRMLDEAKAFDEAFAVYAQANRDSRLISGPPGARYDRGAQEAVVDGLIAAFPNATSGGEGEEAPIFICGMFRSGSTLTEQILAAHSRVTPGGELELLPALVSRELQPWPHSLKDLDGQRIAFLRAAYLDGLHTRLPGADVVTDKRPDNFLHVGLIKTLFPRARIIHTRRDPLDNCLSCWFLHLGHAMPWALDLEDAAHWLIQQERLMDHWKSLWPDDIYTLDYDALVAEPEEKVRGLLNFCGLDWEDGCLSFHALDNAVRTASVWQVREPLYRRASGRWRNYEPHLGSLKAALGRA